MAFDRRSYQREYYKNRRKHLIDMLGGKCVRCNSTSGLEFDHIDSSTKSFSVGMLLNHSWDATLRESEKCQLLCHECHKKKTVENGDGFDKKARGERVGSAKLSEEDVRKILRLSDEGVGPRKIARIFDVSRDTIGDIKAGKSWKHITEGWQRGRLHRT